MADEDGDLKADLQRLQIVVHQEMRNNAVIAAALAAIAAKGRMPSIGFTVSVNDREVSFPRDGDDRTSAVH